MSPASSAFRNRSLVLLPATLLAAWVASLPAFGEDSPPVLSPAASRLKADVSFFAADAQDGRAPGTKGIEASAQRIADTFKELGLKPAPGAEGYFQPFTLRGSNKLSAGSSLGFEVKGETKTLIVGTDFTPLSLGKGIKFSELPVVFAGYGITVDDAGSKLEYDDYAGLDVKGKAVLVLRHEPQMADPKSLFDGTNTTRFADLRIKVANAQKHGAAAFILVNSAFAAKEKDMLVPFNYAGVDQPVSIPALMITRKLADELLQAGGSPKIVEIESKIDADLNPISRALEGVKVAGNYDVTREGIVTKNVIGVLEGSGPLADETIVVGAHYDHLGHGGLMSGSLAFLSSEIHNGADDNASGTSLVLELARRMAKRPEPLPRRIVFMLFSAEEKGLIGSMHYVNNSLYPIDKTIMMLNFDMVGRLNDKEELSIFGLGSSPGSEAIVESLGTAAGFKIKKVRGISDGIGGSDHQSFYMKGIPVLFAFTGLHPDYHKPTDDADKVNYIGMARIADFGELLLLDLARRPKRPEFTKVGSSAPGHGATPPASTSPGVKGDADPARMTVRAYFGSIPDYNEEDHGVKLSGVSEGGPAEKAGLKTGDLIVGFAGKPVTSINDYTEAIGGCKPGDKIKVKVMRGDKEMTFEAILTVRPGAPK